MNETPNLHWLDDRLRLALLKENWRYRGFWAEFGAPALAEVAEAAEAAEMAEMAEEVTEMVIIARILARLMDIGLALQNFLRNMRLYYIWYPRNWPLTAKQWAALLEALNPYSEETPDSCPVAFLNPLAIIPVVSYSAERVNFENIRKPSVHLLAVDLSRPKKEIMAAMARHIDNVAHLRANNGYDVPELVESLAQWEPAEVKRQRAEAWQQLEVWKLRRRKKTYLQIEDETRIKVDAAKKAFARAYELIEGRRYDPERYRRDYAEIKAPELKKICSTCPGRLDCKELCPDTMLYAAKDEVSQQHLLTRKKGSIEQLSTPTTKTACLATTNNECPFCHTVVNGPICSACGTATMPSRK